VDQALSVLETEVSRALHEGRVRAIKVIHGHGSGALRRAVREWCREQEGRFRAVIYGEDYDLFHWESLEMRQVCGQPRDPDLGRKNRAVTYIWLR
jgi:hypothetical protein